MEEFKIDLFEDKTGIKFPKFYTLSKYECEFYYNKFCNIFKYKKENNENSIFEHIQNHGFFFPCNATSDAFSVRLLMDKTIEYVYVVWDEFQTIDRFIFDDINNYFNDIWYSITDDILMFNEDLKIIFLIRHDGVIFYNVSDCNINLHNCY